MRTLLRRLSRNVWFWKRLPARLGGRRVLVSPSSHLAYWKQSLDSVHGEVLGLLERIVRPGDVVWDIGANVGVLSFAAAALAGEHGYVLGVEPNCRLIERLRQSAARRAAGEAALEFLAVCASDRIGVARFSISSVGSAASSLEGFGRFCGTERVELVPTLTLDALAEQVRPPNAIKIDVEGAEALVLAGAQKLMTRHRPMIMVEVGNEAVDPVDAQLKLAGYVALRPDGDGRLVVAPPRADVICVPATRINEFVGTGPRRGGAIQAT